MIRKGYTKLQENASQAASKVTSTFKSTNKLQADKFVKSTTKKQSIFDKFKGFFMKSSGSAPSNKVTYNFPDKIGNYNVNHHAEDGIFSTLNIKSDNIDDHNRCFVRFYTPTSDKPLCIERFVCEGKDKDKDKETLTREALKMFAKKSQDFCGLEIQTGYRSKSLPNDLGIKEMWDLGFRFNDDKANGIVREAIAQGNKFIDFEDCPHKMYLPQEKIVQLIAE